MANQRKKVMYEGKEVDAVDCTPTWEAIFKIHVAALMNPNCSPAGYKSAMSELQRMAQLADRYNELVKTLKNK